MHYRDAADLPKSEIERLLSGARGSDVQLWDMPRINKKHTEFQTVEGRSTTRLVRQEYVFRRFGHAFGDSVLDVGCDEAALRAFCTGRYVGVDLFGNPDVKVNLEQEPLPFEDRSFDMVICVEVLEHLDRMHELFGELSRVSKRHMLVSLPNCWRQYLGDMLSGDSEKIEYGLPHRKPKDRHKWFFNARQAREFIAAQAAIHGFRITEIEHIRNRGYLHSRQSRWFGRELHYPPRKPVKDMSGLERSYDGIQQLRETVMAALLLRGREWRREADIVTSFFLLERSD